jgi:hypothetical protein
MTPNNSKIQGGGPRRDGTFAFIRGPGAVLSVFSRAGMEAMVPVMGGQTFSANHSC